MAAQYSLQKPAAAQNVSVAAGTPWQSAWYDLSGCIDATLTWKVVNGGTGPTVAASVQILYANDYNGGAPTSIVTGNFGGPIQTATGNSVVSSQGGIFLPGGGAFAVVVSGNTGQAVTASFDYTLRVSL